MRVRRGIICGKAPLGYFNEPKLRTIEPHPENSPKLKRIREEFAQGKYSMTGLLREMTRVGLRGGQKGKALCLSSVGHLLENPFCHGAFYHKGVLHQGSHVPMFSKKTWDDIQRARAAVAKPRKRRAIRGSSPSISRHADRAGTASPESATPRGVFLPSSKPGKG